VTPEFSDLLEALETAMTQSGHKLTDLCGASPTLLVFLRHSGCTFCREALGDLARVRGRIEGAGTRIILVHMGDGIESLIAKYGLQELDCISDRDQTLYKAFGLKRGTARQLFSLGVLWRGFRAGILDRHGIGKVTADATQMPGVFLLANNAIIGRFRHHTAADRPDYAGMCGLGTCPSKP
jgi:peroxiredoxin